MTAILAFAIDATVIPHVSMELMPLILGARSRWFGTRPMVPVRPRRDARKWVQLVIRGNRFCRLQDVNSTRGSTVRKVIQVVCAFSLLVVGWSAFRILAASWHDNAAAEAAARENERVQHETMLGYVAHLRDVEAQRARIEAQHDTAAPTAAARHRPMTAR
jgi:hypothetical protein